MRYGGIKVARALRLVWGLARPDPLGFRSEMSACVQPFWDLEHFFLMALLNECPGCLLGSLFDDIRQRNLQPEAWVEALAPSLGG